MAANVDIEKQFLRLIMFCHKISLPVVRTFFVSGVLGCPDYNNDICTFLEHHKHKIFHLVGDYKCCQCTNLHSLQTLKFRLGNDQFKELYDVGLSQPGHFLKGSGGRVFQQCLCCVSVRKDTNPKNYDISLLFAILYNCVPLSDNSVSCLDTIRKSRNRLCHLNDLNDLSEIEIHTLWGNLERSVTRLAGEIPSHPYYKESIEQHVDTFRYTDYNREAITPILESMRSEINNNINEVIQNQMISQEEIRCLTNHVEQLSQNCKKDNQNMWNHVAESAKTSVDLHRDAVHQLSAQVAKCHTEEVELIRDQNKTVIESSEKVSGTMEHVMDKLNFLVDIAIDNKKFQHTQNSSILPKSGKSNERSTTQEQKNSEELDKERCKLHWRIETPGYLEHKKEEIVKAMKNAIEIVKMGTSHEIEDIHEGSITIDTLLPMSILQDKNAFNQSIRKFLEEMVRVCGIDPNIPLVVKVQITLSDLDQGSVKYSIEEMKHTTMIDKAVQAVPTMLDRSTGSSELEIEEELDSTKGPEDDMMIYSVKIKDKVFIPPSEMAFLQNEYNDFRTYKNGTYMLLMGCSNDIRWIESVLTFCKGVAPICHPKNKEKSKKLLNSKNINTFIYIASKSSQRSNDLKSMLQLISESKDLQNNIITVVREDVVISDWLKESKQIRVKIKEKDWLPDLMDAIASSGAILYSVERPSPHLGDFTFWNIENTVLLFGSFRHVKLIKFFLSEYYEHKMPTTKYDICLRERSSVFHYIQRLEGIIFVISDDLKEDFCFHPDIIELKKRAKKELALMINDMTLPTILKGTKQIDATGNNEDWIPNLIDEIQIMNNMVYTMRFQEKNTYGFPSMSHYSIETGLIVLIGNTKDVQWFFSALSESQRVELSMVDLMLSPLCKLFKENIIGLVCITGVNMEIYQVHVSAFKTQEIITITRDETTVPDMLKGTNLVDARGTDCKWISDLIDCLRRLMSTVYILGFKNKKYLYNHSRFQSMTMYTALDDYDDDGFVLLMGNSDEIQRFYTALLKSEIANCSKPTLQCVPARQLHKNTIKSIICIVAKSSKDEDFISYLQIETLECWPNNVVTLVREQTIVPNLLLKTKQVVDSGQDEMWLSDVMDEINRTLSMVYALGIREEGSQLIYTYAMHHAKLIWIIGNFEDIRWFFSALSKSSLIPQMNLAHLCSNHISNNTIRGIMCIVGKTSTEGFLRNFNIQNYECWPRHVLTVVRDTITVPKMMEGTHKIFVDDRDEKWLSEVLHVIETFGITLRVDGLPHSYGMKGSTESKHAFRKRDEITKGMVKPSSITTSYPLENVLSDTLKGKHENID